MVDLTNIELTNGTMTIGIKFESFDCYSFCLKTAGEDIPGDRLLSRDEAITLHDEMVAKGLRPVGGSGATVEDMARVCSSEVARDW